MYAQTNGNETFDTIHGQGRPMLLMHGGPGLDHTHLRPWLDSLSEQVQLIYYDQFGMGRSSRPQSFEGVTHETWVNEAEALRAALGHDRIILFGFSYGGFLAQEYALRYPDHLDGLILCDTAPVVDYPDVIVGNAQARGTPEQVQAVVGGLSDPAAFADDAAFRQVWMTIFSLYFHRYNPQVGAAIDEQTQYSGAAFSHGFSRCLPTFNVLNRLGEIAVPTLVMGGRYDWITPPAQGPERIHAGIPNSELIILEDSGHFSFIEEHDKFVSVVSHWIDDLPV